MNNKTCETCRHFEVFDEPQSKAEGLDFVNFRDGVCEMKKRNMYLLDNCVIHCTSDTERIMHLQGKFIGGGI